MNYYTQKRDQFSNTLTYLTLPIHFQFNDTFRNKNSGGKNLAPTGFIGFNTLLLTSAIHKASGGKERMEKYTERFHYELEGGLGMKIRLKDDLLLENLLIAVFGNPVNTAEYNSTQGTIVNMNLGLRTGLFYTLDSSL